MSEEKPLKLEELIKLIEEEFTEKIQKIDANHEIRWLCIDYYRWQTIKDKIKQQNRLAVQGLLEDIDEVELKNKTLLDLHYEIRQKIKKWFPVEEGERK